MIPLPTLPPAAEAAGPPARRLAPADLPWAAELLSTALVGHPALTYVCAGPHAQAQAAWLLRGLLRFGLHYGTAYANPEGTALALWLPGAVAASPGRLLRAGLLPAAPWRLGLAGCGRLQQLLDATGWLRRQSAPLPHHHLLALAVRPDAQGRGAGRRLLLATLATRQATQTACYTDTQTPALLPFFQRLGFRLVGHCPVGPGALELTNWGLVRGAS